MRSMPSTATIQALFGVSMAIGRGEVVAVIGANGAGKSALLRTHRRPAAGAAGRRAFSKARRSAACRLTPSRRAASRWCRRAGGLFPSLSVEENLLIGGQLGRPGPWTLQRIFELVSGAGGAPPLSQHGAVRRPAADGRDRPGADVESETAVVRRDQPRPGADRGARHLCAAAGDRCAKARRSCWSSRISCRRSRRRSASIACRKAASR